MARKKFLIIAGKMLDQGKHWTALSGSRWTLTFRVLIGQPMTEFDPRRAKKFDGFVERADGTGATGDAIEPGTPFRVVAAASLELEDAKAEKIRLIDARTDELIDDGFEYEEQMFSLSEQAQLKLLGAFSGAAMLPYPVEWNNIDDTGTVMLVDVAEVQAFYGTAMATVEHHLATGTALKNAVNACTNVAQVAAIIDNR